MFELAVGWVPYGSDLDDPSDIYKVIEECKEPEFPEDFEDEDLKRLILQLLNKNPENRIIGDCSSLMTHPFFASFDWDALIEGKLPAPFIPKAAVVNNNKTSIKFKDGLRVG